MAVACAKVCEDKKATDVVILDLRKLTFIADYFVVCSASNERQARAMTEELRATMKEKGVRERGIEGVRDARWIVQDFGDFVVHIFHEDHRGFYDLEGLWADAPRVRWKRAAARP
ncbi:MAG TPA: ribosome silencing factor [Planctomycetota bacterium]|nr:ribosome silencing factor [Planctomycetota bacterium]